MEYIPGLSLYQYLKTVPLWRINQEEVKRIIKQILNAVHYFHKRSICHWDLKLENMLLDSKKNVKLIDFGFATLASNRKLNNYCGTPSYMAPEILIKADYSGFAADIWSCGVIFFVLLTGQYPFKSMLEKDLFKQIQWNQYTYPDFVDEDAKCFLDQIF